METMSIYVHIYTCKGNTDMEVKFFYKTLKNVFTQGVHQSIERDI